MKKRSKFKIGDKLYWRSKKQGKRIEGKVVRINQMSYGNDILLSCGTDGTWEIEEHLLKRVKK